MRQIEELEKKIEQKTLARRKRRLTKMKVSGKSVFNIKKIIQRRADRP